MNLVDDDGFVGAMKEQERRYIFGKKEEVDPLREVIEETSSDEEEEREERKKVVGGRRSTDLGNYVRKFTS